MTRAAVGSWHVSPEYDSGSLLEMLENLGSQVRRAVIPAVAYLAGCQAATSEDAHPEVAARLLELERRATSGTPVSGYDSGDDPFRVRMLSNGRTLVLLRGRSRLVLLDSRGDELDRILTPNSPTGWVFVDADRVFVAGEMSSRIQSYRITDDELVPGDELTLDDVTGIRDLEWLPESQILLAADSEEPRILALNLSVDRPGPVAILSVTSRQDVKLEAPAVEMHTVGSWLLVNELLAHRLLIIPLSPTPEFNAPTEILLDGPIWSFDAVETSDGLHIAVGAVEDHELDRSGGEFGYVDSYLYLYHLSAPGRVPRRAAMLNLSAEGVITPKALRFSGGTLTVTAFGSERLLRVIVEGDDLSVSANISVPAGTTDFDIGRDGRLVLANPLLDEVLVLPADDTAGATTLASFGFGNRSLESRLGEKIFFTTLMAPANISDDHHSRFTCETCHFEGEVDGRTHYTGRGSVFASTKTLRGLAGNVPVFSRGGDSSLTSMVMAEFEVANQFDPWFQLNPAAHPSLEPSGTSAEFVASDAQRIALLTFLIEFGHRQNPFRATSPDLTALERDGLAVFRDRCSACHQPLTSNRDTGRFIPFGEWEDWLTDPSADLIWGAPLFFKTGIEPYVSERGARVPSLRRLSRKVPYFTNGSSPTLRDVLRRFRVAGPSGLHAAIEGDRDIGTRPLSEPEIDALLALLRRF